MANKMFFFAIGARIRTKSTFDDLVEAPEDIFGNPIELRDTQERSPRWGCQARSCSRHPRRSIPGEQVARAGH